MPRIAVMSEQTRMVRYEKVYEKVIISIEIDVAIFEKKWCPTIQSFSCT
jgi:hypothetical protein